MLWSKITLRINKRRKKTHKHKTQSCGKSRNYLYINPMMHVTHDNSSANILLTSANSTISVTMSNRMSRRRDLKHFFCDSTLLLFPQYSSKNPYRHVYILQIKTKNTWGTVVFVILLFKQIIVKIWYVCIQTESQVHDCMMPTQKYCICTCYCTLKVKVTPIWYV